MEIRDWLELAFIGLISVVAGWFKGEHSQIKKRIENLEKSDAAIDKKLAVIESKQESNKEHIDSRLDQIENKVDSYKNDFKLLFERFNKYDEERANFFKEFELKRRE